MALSPDQWGYYEVKFTRRAETAYAAIIVALVVGVVLALVNRWIPRPW